MADDISNNTTEPLPSPSIEERLTKLEQAITEVLAGQKQILTEIGMLNLKVDSLYAEAVTIKEDAKQRYVDLRDRIELTRDKFNLVQRELHEISKDIRNPMFAPADTR